MQLTTEPRTFRWTREEFYRLADAGCFQNRRVELIEGEIIEMPVQKHPHVVSLTRTSKILDALFGSTFWVRTQSPLNLGVLSDAEPDIAVVQGTVDDYADHPTSALLIVEISETTVSYDRGRKGSLYAAAGIQDYWIVNLVDRQLEVYRNPIADANEPSGFRYQDQTLLRVGDVVAPLAKTGAAVAVADLLP